MTVLLYTAGVLLFAVALSASIALHEIGHLLPAKKFGVRCPQYMIGFGPTIWSKKIGDTEYGFKWLPLGGYVKMIGMFRPRPQAREPRTAVGRWWVGTRIYRDFEKLTEEAREQTLCEVQPDDENRVFYKLPVHQKIVVMLGGPLMNLVLGTILIAIMVLFIANPLGKMPAVVGTVNECVVPAAVAKTRTACEPQDPKAPALAAGLQPGDRIVSFNGTQVNDYDQLRLLIRDVPERSVPLVVDRGGRQVPLQITPMLHDVARLDSKGETVLGPDGSPETVKAGFLGIAPSTSAMPPPGGPGDVVEVVRRGVVAVAKMIWHLPERMVGIYHAAFGDEERDPNGPIGVVGVGRLTGETAAMAEFNLAQKTVMMLNILGGLNIALFVFNLVPLPPLDGGQVIGALWEGIKRGWARTRKLADPGSADVVKLLPITYVVGSLLIVMSMLLIFADFINPIRLKG